MEPEIYTKDIDLQNLRDRYGMERSERDLVSVLTPVSIEWALEGGHNTLEEFCMIWSFPFERAKHLLNHPEEITHVEKMYLLAVRKNSYELAVEFNTRWFMKAVYAARSRAKHDISTKLKERRNA